ncbi:MAG: GNAT family N-acetyltransferase, partial [Candidatus Thermoplasmatota archaeon]|nr:GNAT family N-acetyltransferase [Candidatus Thermoplasmatota archaeon]
LIAGLIKAMVVEMSLYGGYPVNESPEVWSSMTEQVKANIARPDYLYLIASQAAPVGKIAGIAEAYIDPVFKIFAAPARLHISAVYTIPEMRRQGVARQLIQSALDWGQQKNVVEADLNVLVANPARQLYERLLKGAAASVAASGAVQPVGSPE